MRISYILKLDQKKKNLKSNGVQTKSLKGLAEIGEEIRKEQRRSLLVGLWVSNDRERKGWDSMAVLQNS